MTGKPLRKRLSPADVNITNVTCVAGSTGLDSTLSLEFTILRTDEEQIGAISIIIDGANSGLIPSEQAGSPTTPGSGLKLHTYTASGSVECGVSHTVQVVAEIVLTTTSISTEETVECPACEI
jgi:hypothetical protein